MKFAKLVASTIAVASVVFSAGIASAQNAPTQDTATRGMKGNYLGAGVSAGVTNGGRQNDAAVLGGNVQGRFAVPNAPVSVRGSALFGGDSTAIIPTLTYDAPIAKNTNVYIGGGYAFQTDEGQASQLGNKNAPVLTLGAESEVAKNTVVYGDAKWGIDAYRGSDSDALSLQAGVGYRF
ncbi:MAG: porin family protein [Scytonema sp. RU_4_4]|nr:porin family protein [Scytonema sp. RU_4_4]NJR73742.1 porin family protein [Scytonema sp. CRU_2_7]